MSRSVSHSSPTATNAHGGGPPTHPENITPMNSRDLSAWILIPEDQESEALVEGSVRFHVDDVQYKDADGNHRCVTKLKMLDQDGRRFSASGVLIGPDLVLTSAHNVRHLGGKDYVSRAISIRVYIGYHHQGTSNGIGVEERFGKRVTVLQEWKRSGFAWHNDMALIELESKFAQVKPALYQAPSLVKSRVLVVGYPGENTTQVNGSCPLCERGGCMYEVAGQARYNSQNLLQYKISTMSGNSGGPVFLESKRKENTPRTVIATHSYSSSRKGTNYAAPVDVAFIEATKAFLSLSHLSPHQNITMHQQGDTGDWIIYRTVEITPSRRRALTRPSRG